MALYVAPGATNVFAHRSEYDVADVGGRFGISGNVWLSTLRPERLEAPTFDGVLDLAGGNCVLCDCPCTFPLPRVFVMTVTIIPFMPNGWDPVAGFPAMAGNVRFLMKDVVLFAASIYLLKQDVVRVLEAGPSAALSRA
jgi:Protein of unknown function, DUF417